jgi:hypothetical protein
VRTEVETVETEEADRPEQRIEPHEKPSEGFSFGGKRATRTGPRRLFAPARSALSPAYQTKQERPHAILRMLAG